MLPFRNTKIVIPKPIEPGSFGAIRKYDVHTGVDLYCEFQEPVYAIEDGIVVRTGKFTGPDVGSPWWNDTDFVTIRGKSGCILYGEIRLAAHLTRGAENVHVYEGMFLGFVIPVLKKDKGRPMNMLHIELYDHDYMGDGVIWPLKDSRPKELKDITPVLKREINRSKPFIRRFLGYIGINI